MLLGLARALREAWAGGSPDPSRLAGRPQIWSCGISGCRGIWALVNFVGTEGCESQGLPSFYTHTHLACELGLPVLRPTCVVWGVCRPKDLCRHPTQPQGPLQTPLLSPGTSADTPHNPSGPEDLSLRSHPCPSPPPHTLAFRPTQDCRAVLDPDRPD